MGSQAKVAHGVTQSQTIIVFGLSAAAAAQYSQGLLLFILETQVATVTLPLLCTLHYAPGTNILYRLSQYLVNLIKDAAMIFLSYFFVIKA